MRYQVQHDPRTQSLSIPELCIEANSGDLRLNMKTLRLLVPHPAILVYPCMTKFDAGWDEIEKETLIEPRIGQENYNDPATEKLDGFSEVDLPIECEIPEPIEGFGK